MKLVVLPAFAAWPQGEITTAELEATHHISTKRRKYEFLRSRALFHSVTHSTGSCLPRKNAPPLWPDHINASLSHKHGHIALLTHQNKQRTLGVDIENNRSLSETAQQKLFTKQERNILQQTEGYSLHSDILGFSLKESIVKCLHGIFSPIEAWRHVEIKDITPTENLAIASSPCGEEVFCQWSLCMGGQWLVSSAYRPTKKGLVDDDKTWEAQILPSAYPDLDIEGLSQPQQGGLDPTATSLKAYLQP